MGGGSNNLLPEKNDPDGLRGYRDAVLRAKDISENRINNESTRLHEAAVKQALRNKKDRTDLVETYRMLASLSAQTHIIHATNVSHMQFSPDGRYLATCR